MIRLALLLHLLACSEDTPQAPLPRHERRSTELPVAPSGALRLTLRAGGAPLAGAAVWVDEAAGPVAPASASLILEKEGFDQHLLVLPPDSALSLDNQRSAPAHVELRSLEVAAGAAPLASRDLPAGGRAGIPLQKAGMAELACSPEPCGSTRLIVGAVGGLTDAAGEVSLSGLAIAPVRVHVWDATRGRLDETLSVVEGQQTAADLTFP